MSVRSSSRYYHLLNLLLVSSLLGCGGGGGGGDEPPPPPTPLPINHAPVIDSLVRDPLGDVLNGGVVTITAAASDSDGNSINYSWSVAGKGELDTTNGEVVKLKVPAGGFGTDTVTLKVTDSKGASVEEQMAISWGVDLSGSFSIRLYESYTNTVGVEGAIVSIYEPDNKTIKQTIVTGADGIADFGAQPANITVLVAYSWRFGTHVIRSAIDVPAGNYVMYVNDKTYSSSCTKKTTVVTDTGINVPAGEFRSISANFGSGYGTGLLLTQAMTGGSSDPYTFCADEFNTNTVDILFLVSDFNFLGYKFITDLDISAVNSEVTVNLAGYSAPKTIHWTTQNVNPINVSFDAVSAKNRSYYLGGDYGGFGPTQLDSSGNTSVGDITGAGHYLLRSIYDMTPYDAGYQKGRTVQEKFASFPVDVTLKYSDREVSDVTYDKPTKSLSFTTTGTDSIDYVQFEVIGRFYSSVAENRELVWTLVAPVNVSKVELMDLPSPVDTWIDTSDISDVSAGSNNPYQMVQYGIALVNIDTADGGTAAERYSKAVLYYMESDSVLDNAGLEQRASYMYFDALPY